MNVISLTIYNKAGQPLGEFIDAEFQSALWRLGDTGVARYSLNPKGPKVTRTNLRPGNRVLIEFGDGLPDWGGVLDWPISLGSGQDISLTFYEGEQLLSWRVTGRNEVFSSTATGAIVEALVQNANAAYATGVYMGDVYSGGAEHTRDYHYTPLLDAVRGLVSESGYDYAVIPTKIGGKLVFDLYWYERRGTDRRDSVSLVEGNNVGSVAISEQGPVFNYFVVVGKGESWGSDRPVATSEDATSISAYGLRVSPKLYLDIDDETTLQAIAGALLDASKDPRVRMTLGDVRNDEPSLFSEYHVGDIVTVEALQTYGEFSYKVPVRILSRQRLADGTCVLEVEKWQGD